MNDFELMYNSEIVCPYCGEEETDSWEWFIDNDNDGAREEVECGRCGKKFNVQMNYDITYHSYPVKEGNEEKG